MKARFIQNHFDVVFVQFFDTALFPNLFSFAAGEDIFDGVKG